MTLNRITRRERQSRRSALMRSHTARQSLPRAAATDRSDESPPQLACISSRGRPNATAVVAPTTTAAIDTFIKLGCLVALLSLVDGTPRLHRDATPTQPATRR